MTKEKFKSYVKVSCERDEGYKLTEIVATLNQTWKTKIDDLRVVLGLSIEDEAGRLIDGIYNNFYPQCPLRDYKEQFIRRVYELFLDYPKSLSFKEIETEVRKMLDKITSVAED